MPTASRRRATVVRLTSVFGPGQVAWEGRHRRDRRVRGARAGGRADRDPRRPASARGTSSTSTTSWRRSRRSLAEGRWNEPDRWRSGRRHPARAAPPSSCARRPAPTAPIETARRDSPAGRERELRKPTRRRSAARLRRPARSRRASSSMSTGSVAIPLLKAAPEPDQLADRLDGGPLARASSCASPAATSPTTMRSRARSRPSGDAAAGAGPGGDRRGAGRAGRAAPSCGSTASTTRRGTASSAAPSSPRGRLARAHHPPVRAARPDRYRPARRSTSEEVERFLRFYAEACLERGVTPLIENVPPVLRMRTGGVFLSPIGGHWRDLLAWRERVPELGFTIDTSHAGAVPLLRGRLSVAVRPRLRRRARARALRRGAGPGGARWRTSPTPTACSARVSPTAAGELELDPLVRAARRARAVHRRRDQRAGPAPARRT